MDLGSADGDTYVARDGNEVARHGAARNPLAAANASPPGSANRRAARGPPPPRSLVSAFNSAVPLFPRRKVFGCYLGRDRASSGWRIYREFAGERGARSRLARAKGGCGPLYR